MPEDLDEDVLLKHYDDFFPAFHLLLEINTRVEAEPCWIITQPGYDIMVSRDNWINYMLEITEVLKDVG